MALYWISGPPAAGKSTLCAALAAMFPKSVVIPVDDIRDWVVCGFAGPVPWTDETEHQYRLGETAACEVARIYLNAGFTVLIDACRNPKRVDQLLEETGLAATRVLLHPSLTENYGRSHSRTNKDFDPHMLDEVIAYTHRHYLEDCPGGWHVLDTTGLTVSQTLELVLCTQI